MLNKLFKKPEAATIEEGYFVFTMMPSLYCELNCPHCYLSREQRRDPTTLSVLDLIRICNSVHEYYEETGIEEKTIQVYWYGGEPTSMDPEYFESCVESMSDIFSKERGYTVLHTVLSSLLNVNEEVWFPLLEKHCDGVVQTSFDYTMRGKSYMRKWEESVKRAKAFGLEVSTISVVNESFLKWGAEQAMTYLTDLGVKESSWLPFMENEQNSDTGMYSKFAPTMKNYSEFMIALNKTYLGLKSDSRNVPHIGQRSFIFTQSQRTHPFANIAAQTLFLMPDGSFCLPDYHEGTWKEYMHDFGNALEIGFKGVLKGKQRKSYLRKQVKKNGNKECQNCDYSSHCVMEFWKDNREDDDCFGAKKYVTWLHKNEPAGFQEHKAVLY
jgi:sulfatase maturation enzyme AslB (radical SAM superfamily)